MAEPFVRDTKAPRAGRITGVSTGLETEAVVALQYQDDEAEVEDETHSRFTCCEKNCVLFADQRVFTTLRIGGAAVI